MCRATQRSGGTRGKPGALGRLGYARLAVRSSPARRAGDLRRWAIVVVQNAAEPFATLDRRGQIGVVVGGRGERVDQFVVEALMAALGVIVLDELRTTCGERRR